MNGKNDEGKLKWHLLPLAPVEAIIRVLMYGAKKYSPFGWQKVVLSEDGFYRYYDALMRHLADFHKGEAYDQESGHHHLAHAGCDLLYILWYEITVLGKSLMNKKSTG